MTEREIKKSITETIKKYVSEEELHENYMKVCKKFAPPDGLCIHHIKERIAKECRTLMLKKIPANEFNLQEKIFISKNWGIEMH